MLNITHKSILPVLVAATDSDEEKKVSAWTSEAKKELDDWYKHHGEQLEKTRGVNR